MTGQALGVQGGDHRGRATVRLDLSTCVNPYGPPPAVMARIRRADEGTVRRHPYEATAVVEQAYACYLGLPAQQLVAISGTSEMIWLLAREFRGRRVGLPLPTYTEFRRAFADAVVYGGGPSTHSIAELDTAMSANDAVVFANPHNPTGQVIDRAELLDLAARYPSTTLVVDESYLDFLPEGAAATLVGCPADNMIVLRSPSKFFGLAGLRSGVAWSRLALPAEVEAWRSPWPISAVAAEAVAVALQDEGWASATRQRLTDDAVWLDENLADTSLVVAPGQLHFRLVTGAARRLATFAEVLETHGIAVRVLGDGHGVGTPAARIASPAEPDRALLRAALRDLAGSRQ